MRKERFPSRAIVTGGCGFIGSNLIGHLLETFPEVSILNLDALTYAGSEENVEEYCADPRYSFSKIDIVNRKLVAKAIREFQPDAIFHLAAETHVDNSIEGSSPFVATNFVGTYNLLEEARIYWDQSAIGPGRFLHVSTDEVYGSIEGGAAFNESSPYRPNSPYSATKAGSDHLVRAWHHTYGLDVVITNCSNNFGPKQHREKLIPTVVASALEGKPIPVYGDGSNVRDWLYVMDHCSAIQKAFSRGIAGETYVIGTRNEWKNIELVSLLCSMLDELVGGEPKNAYSNLITFVRDRPGHDKRYAVDPEKAERELEWSADTSFEDGIRQTVSWYADIFRAESTSEEES